jgi:2'-5' RNA ligase
VIPATYPRIEAEAHHEQGHLPDGTMMGPVTARLFVAVWPDDAARDALADTVERARQAAPEVRWQPPERWHITVAFLGVADPGRAAARISVFEQGDTSAAEPIRLVGAGAFGPVVWVGVEHGPWLADLARKVQLTLHVADRRFRAHVTVGRLRGDGGAVRAREVVPLLASHVGPSWTPGEITLVESVTGPAPEYHILASWPLRPPSAGRAHAPSNRDTAPRAVPHSGVPTLEEP